MFFFSIKTYLFSLCLAVAECFKIIQQETRQLLRTSSFLNAKPLTVQEIFNCATLAIMSEMDLLVALAIYAKHNKALPSHCSTEDADLINQEKFNTCILPALQLIRFPAVATRDFLNCSEIKTLLTPEQILGIACEQIDRNIKTYSLPEGFSVETISRGMNENRPVRSTRSNLSSYSGLSGRSDAISEFSQRTSDLANGLNPNTAQISSSTNVNVGSTPQSPGHISITSNMTVNSLNEWERDIENYRNAVENEKAGALDLALGIANCMANVDVTGNGVESFSKPIQSENEIKRREKLQFGDFGTQNHDDSLVAEAATSSTPRRKSIGETIEIPQTQHQSLNENTEKVNGSGTVDKEVTNNIKNVPQKRSCLNVGKKPTKRRGSIDRYEWDNFVDK